MAGAGGPSAGSWIFDALARLKALTVGAGSAEAAAAGRPVEAELKGNAHVGISIKVDGGMVTDSHVSSSGNVRADVGTSMTSAISGASVY